MASANPFALIGNNNPSLEDEDDEGDDALLESAREAARTLLEDDDDDISADSSNKSGSRNQKLRGSTEGWVNEYQDKAVQEPDPSQPFVYGREWLLKLHRPDYAMPSDFVFTPTITTQEPLPPVAFLPRDDFVRSFFPVALTETRQIPRSSFLIHFQLNLSLQFHRYISQGLRYS